MHQESRISMRKIHDKNPPGVGRQSREFMREILDKNLPRVGRQIHTYGTYEKVKISRRKGPEMDPKQSSQRAHMRTHVAQNGLWGTLGKSTKTEHRRTSARVPITWTLDCERAIQTLRSKPKTQFPSHIYQKYGEHCFDRILGPTMCQSELRD